MQIIIDEILQYLNSKKNVSQFIDVTADETDRRGFYKIRCKLIRSFYMLQIKIINTPDEFIYSYQLFTDKPLLRWDNSPHYPDINTYPHHFQDSSSQVHYSNLTGINIKTDFGCCI